MSVMYYLEVPIDASVSDILAFLKRENRLIHPEYHQATTPDEENFTVNFHAEIKNNILSIYTKIYTTPTGKSGPKNWLDAPSGQGNEVIRFEVIRVTDTRSLIKSSRASSCEVMFWRRWERLAITFGASFASEAQRMLAEVERIEVEEVKQILPDNTEQILDSEDVFISYNHQDKEYANELYEAFENKSISVWMDKKIETSANWLETLRVKIENSAALVVIMSSTSCKSEYVQNEILLAQRKGKDIFPLLLEGECCWFLGTKQYKDVKNKTIPSSDFFLEVKEKIEKRKTR